MLLPALLLRLSLALLFLLSLAPLQFLLSLLLRLAVLRLLLLQLFALLLFLPSLRRAFAFFLLGLAPLQFLQSLLRRWTLGTLLLSWLLLRLRFAFFVALLRLFFAFDLLTRLPRSIRRLPFLLLIRFPARRLRPARGSFAGLRLRWLHCRCFLSALSLFRGVVIAGVIPSR